MEYIRKFNSGAEADEATLPTPNVILIAGKVYYNYTAGTAIKTPFIRMGKGCYVDTLIPETSNFSRVEGKVRINGYASSNGSVASDGSAGCYVQPAGNIMWYAGRSNPSELTTPYNLGDTFTFVWEGGKFYVDGQEIGSIAFITGSGTKKWHINAAGDLPTNANFYNDMDFFYLKLWADNILIHDFEPSIGSKIVDSVTANEFVSAGSVAMQYMTE